MHLVGCILICTVHVYKSYFISNSFDCHFQFFGKEMNIPLLLDELDLSLYKVLYFCNVNFLLQNNCNTTMKGIYITSKCLSETGIKISIKQSRMKIRNISSMSNMFNLHFYIYLNQLIDYKSI